MQKILLVVLIAVSMVLVGCGKKAKNEQPAIPTITITEAQLKLKELSAGLEVREDDMKEVTYCLGNVDSDVYSPIWIVPYVVIDKEFKVELYKNTLYVGNEPLNFSKLYVKTKSGVEKFQCKNIVKSYAGEEYNGVMDSALYAKLKEAVAEGYGKFRLEGRLSDERELTTDELWDMEKVFELYEFFKRVKVVNI